MADPIISFLEGRGPTRGARLAEYLCADHGTTPEAARKRLSRARPPIRTFPIPLLPKREAFLYLQDDRNSERFWENLTRDMRDTESAAGSALDGLLARGGIVAIDEFPVISGAPQKQKKQIPAALILSRLMAAGIVSSGSVMEAGEVVMVEPRLGTADMRGFKTRQLAEGVMLDGVREWARRLGVASYNSMAIRGDDHPRMVGPYKWDLTGPGELARFVWTVCGPSLSGSRPSLCRSRD